MILSPAEAQTLLTSAREAITAHLEHRTPVLPEATGALAEPCGAFVTLRIGRTLRGCIGSITAAVESAFHDPRFAPLSALELGRIAIELSVLSPLRQIESIEEIVPGTHGIYLRYGSRSGLLLPQVAEEHGWDRETFLRNTCYKAGLMSECWQDPRIEIFIFTAEIFTEPDRTESHRA
jgi:AmmeMemoRadiSam system protein A